MKKEEALEFYFNSESDYFTYSLVDVNRGNPVKWDDIQTEIEDMTSAQWGNKTLYECDEKGVLNESSFNRN